MLPLKNKGPIMWSAILIGGVLLFACFRLIELNDPSSTYPLLGFINATTVSVENLSIHEECFPLLSNSVPPIQLPTTSIITLM